jgi:hypothetical protein
LALQENGTYYLAEVLFCVMLRQKRHYATIDSINRDTSATAYAGQTTWSERLIVVARSAGMT